MGSGDTMPFRIIPERGQVTEDDSKSSSNECWTVLHEHESRSNLASDPRHVTPEPAALAVDSGAGGGANIGMRTKVSGRRLGPC